MSAAATLVLATACAAALVLALCAQSAVAVSQWQTVAQLPGGARSHMAVVARNNGDGLLLMGGYAQLDGSAPPTDLYNGTLTGVAGVNYEIFGDAYVSRDGVAWKALPPLPLYSPTGETAWAARANHAACVASYVGTIFLYGGVGRDGALLDDLWTSSGAQSWARAPTPLNGVYPGARAGHAMTYGMATPSSVASVREVFVIGGHTAGNDLAKSAQVWRVLDTGSGWTMVHDSSTTFGARWGHSAVTIGGVPIIAGGFDGTGTPRNDVWRATDYSGASWQLLTNAAEWTPRAYFGLPLFNTAVQSNTHVVTTSSALAFAVGGNGQTATPQRGAAYNAGFGLNAGSGWSASGLVDYNDSNARAGVVAAAVVYECNALWSIGGLQGGANGDTTPLSTSAAVRRLDLRSLSSLGISQLSGLPARCSAGYYGCASYCYQCQPGTVAPNSGSFSCASCDAGTYASSYGATSCRACPAGTYSSTAGRSTCSSCALNMFSDNAGATQCTACPAGSYTTTTGATSCSGGNDDGVRGWSLLPQPIGSSSSSSSSSSSYTNGRAYASAVALANNQGIFLFGGWMQSTYYETTPSSLYGLNVVMSSSSGTFMGDAWRSQDGGQTWTESFPYSVGNGYVAARAAHAMTNVVQEYDTTSPGTTFLYGGVGYSGILSDAWRFTQVNGAWTLANTGCAYGYSTCATSPGPRAGHALVGYTVPYYVTHLFLLGGATSTTVASAEVWFSSDSASTWTRMTSTAAWGARVGHSAMMINGVMYLMGGYSTYRTAPTGDVWMSSDTYHTAWTLVSSATAWTPRGAFHGAVNAALRTQSNPHTADVTVFAGGVTDSTSLSLSGAASVQLFNASGGPVLSGGSTTAVVNQWNTYDGRAELTAGSVAVSLALGLTGAPMVYQCGFVYSLTGLYTTPSSYSSAVSYAFSAGVRRIRINDLLNNTQLSGATNATAWPCPAGQSGCNGVCTACAVGSYSGQSGAPTCAPCPAGTFSNAGGRTACTTCYGNTYMPWTGASTCYTCAAGTNVNYQRTGCNSPSSGGSGSGVSTGAIVGAVVGSFFGVALLAGIVACCIVKRRNARLMAGAAHVEGAVPYNHMRNTNSNSPQGLGMVVIPPAASAAPAAAAPVPQQHYQPPPNNMVFVPQQHGGAPIVVVPAGGAPGAAYPAVYPAQPVLLTPDARNAPPPAYVPQQQQTGSDDAAAAMARAKADQHAMPYGGAPAYDAAAHQQARVVVVNNGGGVFAPLNAQAP